MKNLKINIFLIAFFVLNFDLVAQDSTKKSFRISVLPSQFLFTDFPIILEYVKGRFTYGISPSVKFSTQYGGKVSDVVHGEFGDYKFQNMFNKLYNAFTISLNSKYYFREKDRVYFEAILFYRHWWFDKKNAVYENIEGYSFNELRTEHQNVFGVKFLMGKTFVFWEKSKLHPIIDCYFGLGCRYKMYYFKSLDNDFNVTNVYDGSYWWLVSPQIGIKLGFEVRLKPKQN